MTAALADVGKLDIGRVIQETFGVLRRNFVTFLVLSLVLSGLPTAAISYVQAGYVGAGGALNFNSGYFTSLGIGVLAAVVTSSILQGALIFATVQDMNGQKPSIGECLATGLRAFLPLIGVSILFGLAIVFGFVLLIVPGLILICMWCVAVPALVADRTGVFGAFSRSAALTKGNRWRIFGLLVVIWIVLLVVSMVIGSVSMGLAFSTSGLDPIAMARSPVQIASNLVLNTFNAMVTSAGAAVLYVELRKAREGLGPQWLAEVFS